MQLQIKPYPDNRYPLQGILIKGDDITGWVKEIQRMKLSLTETPVYPISGTTANTIWGCFVDSQIEKNKVDIGKNSYCQLVHKYLLIPEKAELVPQLSSFDVEKLFGSGKHIMHPEFDILQLPDAIEWHTLIDAPFMQSIFASQPSPAAPVPTTIKSFQIIPVAAEDVLEEMEKKSFPKRKNFEDKPLNRIEKIKLFAYKALFGNAATTDGKETGSSFLSKIFSAFGRTLNIQNAEWLKKMQLDYDELEKRNQKHFDKLMNLFKDDPFEALKYAIPLDNEGFARGGQHGAFEVSKNWDDFSLFGNQRYGKGGGSVIMPDDAYNRLHNQYTATAKHLIEQKEYHKAAFVYMKLLKNYQAAAQTLEQGNLFKDAASVYLKYTNNKHKAAECYEKGNMIQSAIELYKELAMDEKTGDLYLSINKKEEAFFYYEKVAENYKSKQQFVKASLFYKNKMNDENAGQQMLLQGWRTNTDAFNCLNNYFSNIKDEKILERELYKIYSEDVSATNRNTFLQVLKPEYQKRKNLTEQIRNMAYDIISKEAVNSPLVLSELRIFNEKDPIIIKDALRYRNTIRNSRK